MTNKKRSTTHKIEKNPFAEKVITESNLVQKAQTVIQKSISFPTTSEFDEIVRANSNPHKISIENVSQDIELKEVSAYQSPDDDVNLSDDSPGPNDFNRTSVI